MYNLALHIEYLLLHHDCVVLPGIGAFINVRHSAAYDETNRLWTPMTREVRFNGALKHDDGLLSTSYARKNSVDFSQGRELLREDLNRLKTTLNEDGEVTMGNLGILSYNEGVLSFRPLQGALQRAMSSGYSQVIIPGKIDDVPQVGITEDKKEASVPLSVENENNPASQADTLILVDTSKNYYIRINKKLARTAASLLLITVIVLSVFLPGANRAKIDKASVLPLEQVILSKIPQRSEALEVDELMKEDESSTQEIQTNITEKAEKNYHIIVGTFMTEKEAEAYRHQNLSEKYSLQLVATPTRVRVSAMSSADRSQLVRLMQTAEFQQIFPQSWIWEEQN